MDILSTELLLTAYQRSYFPMADPYDGRIYWHSPDPRAVFPLERIKIHKSVRQSIKKYDFTFRINYDFKTIISRCSKRSDTWISDEIIDTYTMLNILGFAHSVETYHDGRLVGGLYGVSIGGAFFGESMYSEMKDASKAAFFYLVYILKHRGFILLDSQYLNDHTKLLGAIEIPKNEYIKILDKATKMEINFI